MFMAAPISKFSNGMRDRLTVQYAGQKLTGREDCKTDGRRIARFDCVP